MDEQYKKTGLRTTRRELPENVIKDMRRIQPVELNATTTEDSAT